MEIIARVKDGITLDVIGYIVTDDGHNRRNISCIEAMANKNNILNASYVQGVGFKATKGSKIDTIMNNSIPKQTDIKKRDDIKSVIKNNDYSGMDVINDCYFIRMAARNCKITLETGELADGTKFVELGRGSMHLQYANEKYIDNDINKQYIYFDGIFEQCGDNLVLRSKVNSLSNFKRLSNKRKGYKSNGKIKVNKIFLACPLGNAVIEVFQ